MEANGPKVTIVVLEVRDDCHDREWWEALGLPEPSHWNLEDERGLGEHVFVKTILEKEVIQ